jgi:hypothetical protein
MTNFTRILFYALNGREKRFSLCPPKNGENDFVCRSEQGGNYAKYDAAVKRRYGDEYSLRGYFHHQNVGPQDAACQVCQGKNYMLCTAMQIPICFLL